MSDREPATRKKRHLFVHSEVNAYPLTSEQFRVFADIASRDGERGAFPSIKTVASCCHLHEDTVRRALHALTEYGVLSVTDRSSKGQTNVYRVASLSNWMPAEKVRDLQAKKAAISKAQRGAKKNTNAEARTAGKPIEKQATREQQEVVNGGTASTEKEAGSGRKHASETRGGEGGVNEGGHASETKGGEGGVSEGGHASETKGAECIPVTTSIERDPGERQSAPTAPPLDISPQAGCECSPTQSSQGSEMPPDQKTVQAIAKEPNAKDFEKVPGGAAGGETEVCLRRTLGHSFVDTLLNEAETNGHNHRRTWFDIPLDRAGQLVKEAWATHTTSNQKFRTRLKDLLDQEVQRTGLLIHFESDSTPLSEDGEIDMAALIATAPLNGRRRA